MEATMRPTTFTDFALRALMWLVGDPDRTFTTEEIAIEFGISSNHLTKVIRDLANIGIVSTYRGGGFRLARPSKDITFCEIVRSREARQALVECFRADGDECVLTPRYRLKGRLSVAQVAFLRALDGTTLAHCAYRN
jgi:Rrf2 family transcriptional regulator, nitric oxide-sensitive transcriptional repressor